MGKWQEYNPDTGLLDICDHDELAGTLTVHKQADVEPVVEACKAIANSRATDEGLKKGLWSYCVVPLAVQYEMLWKHGVDINNRDHWPRLFHLVNTEYPYLKTTHRHHEMKGGARRYLPTAASSPKPIDSSTPVISTPRGT